MKRGTLTTVFVLSLVFILSIQFIAAGTVDFLSITDETYYNNGYEVNPVAVITFGAGENVEWSSLNLTDEDGVKIEMFNSTVLSNNMFFYTFYMGNVEYYDMVAYAKFTGTTDPVASPTIRIYKNNPPIASFTVDNAFGLAPLAIQFTDASSDAGGQTFTWAWDFGDNIGTSILQSPTYTFDTAGTYEVSLNITEEDTTLALTSIFTKQIVVRSDCLTTVVLGDTCIPIPADLACSGSDVAGLKCDDASAGMYCRTYQNGEYKSGSMVCDGDNTHTLVNYGSPGSCGGSGEWVESLICIGEGAPGNCVDTDESYSDPTLVKGNVTVGDADPVEDVCASDDITLNEKSCSSLGALVEIDVICLDGCVGGACLTAGGAGCEVDSDKGVSAAPLKSRLKGTGDKIYYCGLDSYWHETILIDSGDACLEDYQCESNTCVDGVCISITAELQAQRSILQRIWCFLTNMNSYFAGATDLGPDAPRRPYCDCLYRDDGEILPGMEDVWEDVCMYDVPA